MNVRLILITIAALALGTALLFRGNASVDEAIGTRDGMPPANGTDRHSERTSPPVLLVLPHYLANRNGFPDSDRPLADSIDALRLAANAGNPTAACRLTFAVRRCRMVKAMTSLRERKLTFTDGLLPEDSSRDAMVARLIVQRIGDFPAYQRDAANAALTASMSLSPMALQHGPHPSDEAFCNNAPDVAEAEWRGWLRQAAMAGEPQSMVAYASGQAWMEQRFADRAGKPLIDDPEFLTWTREAPAVLNAAIQRGDAAALLLALRASAGGTQLSAAWPVDERRDAILSVIALRLEGRPEIASTAAFGLDTDESRSADHEARLMFETQFAASGHGLWNHPTNRIGRPRDGDGLIETAECEQ